jgi:ribonuclease J
MMQKTENERSERPRIKPPEIHPRPAPSAPGVPGAPRAPRRDERPRGPRRGGRRMDRQPIGRSVHVPKTAIKPREPARETGAAAAKERRDDVLRFVPLGGLEEIGRNCMYLEYKNEIVMIDAGLQFPEEETPGIDYIIPNVASLEKKRSNIHALILTHGHYDHIGAIPHIIERIGNPPVYATSITKAIIEKRQEDFPNSPKLNIITVKNGDSVKISNYFEAMFFGVPHTIPETTGVVLKTPVGNIVHFADFRLDYNEKDEPQGLEEFAKIGKMGVHSLMIDSTNAEEAGHSLSEKMVEKNLEEIFKHAEGRIIVATFASLITRIAEIIKIAEKLGRKVALNGYSMRTNIQIAQSLGFVKPKEGTIVPVEEVNKMRDDKILILSTGAQGESNAGLMKMITGEHRHMKIKQGDTFVLSSSVIPGNERSVQSVKDNLARQGAIVYHSALVDIHSSGHAPKEDLKLVMELMKPKFLVPVHGYYFMRAANGISAREVGIPRDRVILMDNGQVSELTKDEFTVTKETVPAYYVMVDGLGVGDVEEVVIRDRRALAAEGMMIIILTIDHERGRLLKNPDIISRGFIYLKEHQGLLDEIRKRVRGLMQRLPARQEAEPDYIKTLLRDQVGQYLYNKTRRRPMILPVVIEV